MAYLLDTSTISYALRGNQGAADRLHEATGRSQICSSVITEGELLYGVSRLARERRAQILGDVTRFLSDLAEIVPVSRGVADAWGYLRRAAELRGRPVAANDLWIAATALHHDMILVTHDSDFMSMPELRLEDWVA